MPRRTASWTRLSCSRVQPDLRQQPGAGPCTGRESQPHRDRGDIRPRDPRGAKAGDADRPGHPHNRPHAHCAFDRWAQGAIALDRRGRALTSFQGGCRFCAAGAVGLAAHVLSEDEAARHRIGATVDHTGRLLDCAAYKIGDYESYIGLNEHDTHARVVAMFDHALDMARADTDPARRRPDRPTSPPRPATSSSRRARSSPGPRHGRRAPARATPRASPSPSSIRTPSRGAPRAPSTPPSTPTLARSISRPRCSGPASAPHHPHRYRARADARPLPGDRDLQRRNQSRLYRPHAT